jgi:hypothetical protein
MGVVTFFYAFSGPGLSRAPRIGIESGFESLWMQGNTEVIRSKINLSCLADSHPKTLKNMYPGSDKQ